MVLMAGCGGGSGGDRGAGGGGAKAAVTAPAVEPAEMVKSQAAASRYVSFTTQEAFGPGCVNAIQCQVALNLLQPYVPPLAEALDEEAGEDPYYKGLVGLADKVAAGVQATEASDGAAMDALLKDVVKLRDRLGEYDLGAV